MQPNHLGLLLSRLLLQARYAVIFALGFGTRAASLALRRMFNRVISAQAPPRYLSTHHDPLSRYHRWQANLRVLDIEPVKTVPYVPSSHPCVECLIGTARRGFLDQTLFWSSLDLERNLSSFRDYCNGRRVHSLLGGQSPNEVSDNSKRQPADVHSYRWMPQCGELYQLPVVP